MKRVNYITVLDFMAGEVFQYEIGVNDVKGDERFKKWYPDSESCEEFISDKGHHLGSCQWMVHESDRIIKNY